MIGRSIQQLLTKTRLKKGTVMGPKPGFKQCSLVYVDRKCRGCSKTYTPTTAGQKYCSTGCGKNAARKAHREAMRTWRRDNRAHARRLKKDWDLRRQFGISLSEYETLLAKQGGVCAICARPETCGARQSSFLSVDHDHVTNKIRGLLCNKCNRGLGLFEDNVEWLSNAIDYLGGLVEQRHKSSQAL